MRFALCFILLCVFANSAGFAGDKEKSLKKFQQKIDDQQKRLKGLLKKERSLLQSLNRYSKEVDRLNYEITKLDRRSQATETRISEASNEIDDLRVEVEKRRDNIGKRVRDLYMWGRPNYLRVLLAAESQADFGRRRWFVRRWIEEDQKTIKEFGQIAADLGKKRTNLEEDQRKLEKLIRGREKNRKALQRERNGRKNLLSLVENQRDFYKKSIAELQQAAKDLQRLMETLRRRDAEEDVLFARMKGQLLLPVKGKLEKRFGSYLDPRVRTKLHHKGIDLRVGKGMPIRAVFDGRVVYADWFVGYGKIIILDHNGGYFTLYAHVDRLMKKVGDSVTVGDTIAQVGDTGSLKGAYLYFELRHKGISQDPWPWFARGPGR